MMSRGRFLTLLGGVGALPFLGRGAVASAGTPSQQVISLAFHDGNQRWYAISQEPGGYPHIFATFWNGEWYRFD